MVGPEFEVILVDQNKTPMPGLFQENYPFSLRQLAAVVPNASLARNIGMREASGEIILFLDDDIRIPDAEFLQKHVQNYFDASTSGVYGQVLEIGQAPTDGPSPALIETDWGWMSLPANYGRACRTRNGGAGNLSVRRDWAMAAGGMDAWFEKGARREETEFNLRYTKRYGMLVFDPTASLIHLSAGGGSRTWGRVLRTVPMHHIIGHWYFLLRAVRDKTLGVRGLAMELRYVAIALLKNPQVGWDPFVFLQNAGRAAWGLAIALVRLARGPRRIETLDVTLYRDVTAKRPKA